MSTPQPEAGELAFVEQQLGELRSWRFVGWEGSRSRVWSMRGADGRRAVLKRPASKRKFDQELAAFQDWVPKLGRSAPRLLAEETSLGLLLMSELPGRLLEGLRVPREIEADAFRSAGGILRRIHALPFQDDDPVDFEQAMAKRLDSWMKRADGLIDERTVDWLRSSFAVPGLFGGLARVRCHRDFQPRNWMVEVEDGRLGALRLIDFEHAYPDCRLVDFLKLREHCFPDRPDLEEAFFSAYGRRIDEREETQLAVLLRLHAVTTIAWAKEQGDAEFEEQGRTLVRRLQQQDGLS